MPSFGRKPIYTKYPEIKADNICQVLMDVMPQFRKNQEEIRHLYRMYRGRQPILNRVKDVRPEINNKIVLNHANEIVSFKVSYLLSEPIMYVKRGTKKGNKAIAKLSDFMHLEAKAAKDKEIADDFNICGTAYRMVLPSRDGVEGESPFHVYTLHPSRTFLIRYTGLGEPVVCGVYIIVNRDPQTHVEHETACVYTPKMYFEVEINNLTVAAAVTRAEPHTLGCVPIVEYINNHSRIGSFEIVESLLDAMNALESARLDGTEQTVQSLMVFKNCEFDGTDDLAAMRQEGAVMLKSQPGVDANIELMAPNLNQADQQVLHDSLYQSILSITGMPTVSDGKTSDSSNNGAAFMRGGWYSADARAKDSELLWKRSETEFLRIVLKICRDMGVLNLSVADVDMKFTRRNYEDILSKSQTLTNMLTAGIDPLHAIAQCGLFGDPSEVYEASVPYLDKWKIEQDEPQDTQDEDEGEHNHQEDEEPEDDK